MHCPTNARFAQRYSLGSPQVCMHTYSWFEIISYVYFLCVLYSQMPGLGSAIPSRSPVIFARFFSWFVLFSNVFPLFCFQFAHPLFSSNLCYHSYVTICMLLHRFPSSHGSLSRGSFLRYPCPVATFLSPKP